MTPSRVLDDTRSLGNTLLRMTAEFGGTPEAWLHDPAPLASCFAHALLDEIDSLDGQSDTHAFDAAYRSVQTAALIAGRWAVSGCPTVVIDSTSAAALATAPVGAAATLQSPWPGFVIRLPDGFLNIDDVEHGDVKPATMIGVAVLQAEALDRHLPPDARGHGDGWFFKLTTEERAGQARLGLNGLAIWGYNYDAASMVKHLNDGRRWDTRRRTSRDELTEQMTRAIIVNSSRCLADGPSPTLDVTVKDTWRSTDDEPRAFREFDLVVRARG
jgi:hypothetical protein